MIPAHVILASGLIFQVKHYEILLYLLHTFEIMHKNFITICFSFCI